VEALEKTLRALGAKLGQDGLRQDQIVVDLDETMWDWSMPLDRQHRLYSAHREWITVRRPLLWLLAGMGGGPLNAWTAGYGYRVDRVCEREPLLADLLALFPAEGQRAEQHPTVVTCLDFLGALRQDPGALPHGDHRWVSQKIPGSPSRAQKPRVDEARILIDDKETNCRRFVAASPGHAAIWLMKTPRVWADNLPRHFQAPKARMWARGVADALDEILRGQASLVPVAPEPTDYGATSVQVDLPHRRVLEDWVRPSREVKRIVRRRFPEG